MKNSKCLFDRSKQTPEGMVSVSQLQSFMSCPKKWEYGYIENLTPRVERPFLMIGKLCHKGMQVAFQTKWNMPESDALYQLNSGLQAIAEDFNEYLSNNSFLDEEMPDLYQTFEDAKSVFTQAFWEFGINKWEVLTLYKDGQPIPALELHFVVPCTGSKGLHGYIDAILKDKETGHVWCTDYKFRKSLSPDEEEITNIQNAVYTHACDKMRVKITGTQTWQHVNTPVADPQVLKNGTLSRAKIKTTWKHYKQCCWDRGLNPDDYREEMKEKLSEIEWFRPTFEYRNAETIKRMWNECIVPAAKAVKSAYKGNNRRSIYPWNCKMCQYKDLCQAELRDHDAAFVRETQYTVRHHGR